MSLESFSEQIKNLLSRTDALKEHAHDLLPADQELLPVALEELQTSLEELKVAEEELMQQSEELFQTRGLLEVEHYRYQELFDDAPDGYLVTDKYGKVVAANRAAAALLKIPTDFLLDKPIAVFLSIQDRHNFRIELLRLDETDRKQDWEVKLHPRDHSAPIDVSLTVVAVRDNDGNPPTLRWTIRDVTEQRRDREQLRLLNAELERRVSERTAELEKAVQQRDEFLSIAAHELRTPITSLRGFAQAAMRHLEQADHVNLTRIRRAFQVIDEQSGKMTKLIAHLLDVTRIEAGQLSLDRAVTDLVGIVENAVALSRSTTDQHVIMLKSVPTALGHVDALRIEQVILNLLDNAIKYSPDGGAIDVDLSVSNGEICLSVTDHGIGIPTSERDVIFERFHRGSSSKAIGGLGLGLYICREVVHLHGGQLTFESPSEGGTRFILRLAATPPAA